MSVFAAPVTAGPHAWVARANPVVKLGVALGIAVVLLLSVDVVSAGVALAFELVALPWSGLSARQLPRRTWPVLIGAATAGLSTLLLGAPSGATWWAFGPFRVSDGSASSAVAIVLRVCAIGLPGVVLLATTDPTDLADALAQRLGLPHRFVLGALAGLRLVGLLVQDWRTLALARRARGVGDARGPLGSVRVLAGQAFALFVIAVRRGTRLAVAMEARGFGGAGARTWARPSRFSRADAALTAGGALAVVAAVVAAVSSGAWNFVLS